MPLPFHRSKKDDSLSPEIQSDGGRRSNLFSKPSYSTSETKSSSSSFVSKGTESLSKSSIEVQETPVEASGDLDYSAPSTTVDFVRPKTPPQGTNHSPWTSYHDLPANHPVFAYSAEKREKLYAQGIDPVYKAWFDLGHFGTVYGESGSKSAKRHVKQFLGSLGNANSSGVTATGWNGGLGPC